MYIFFNLTLCCLRLSQEWNSLSWKLVCLQWCPRGEGAGDRKEREAIGSGRLLSPSSEKWLDSDWLMIWQVPNENNRV